MPIMGIHVYLKWTVPNLAAPRSVPDVGTWRQHYSKKRTTYMCQFPLLSLTCYQTVLIMLQPRDKQYY